MKTNSTPHKQRGFFDLGFSLGLMLIFGGSAAVIDNNNEQKNNLAKPATEIVDQKVIIVKSEQD